MNVAVCRACLIETDKVQIIRNTQYQEVYEKLSNTKLITEDGRPDTVCYSCYSQLQKCLNFSIMSQRADNMLTQHYCDGIELSPVAVATLHKICDSFGSLKNPDNLPPSENFPSAVYMLQADVAIKEEADPVKVELVEIEEGCMDEDIKIEDEIKINENTKKNTPYRVGGSLRKPEKQEDRRKTMLLCKPLTGSGKMDSDSDKMKKHDENVREKSYIFTEKVSLHQDRNRTADPYSCDMCDKTFAHKTNLRAHIKIHVGQKLSACDRCGKTFPNGYQLKRHMRSHTGEKPYKCDRCHRTFADRSNLKKHITNHLGQKAYNCTECNTSFSQKGNLRRHMRCHTGEKPFFCDICQKSLPDASLLRRHMRIHTGEKPYVCDACGKAYSDKDNFKSHLRLHSGEKPYICGLCDYRSAHANCLKMHAAKKHSGTQ